jgi:hypothetical protein
MLWSVSAWLGAAWLVCAKTTARPCAEDGACCQAPPGATLNADAVPTDAGNRVTTFGDDRLGHGSPCPSVQLQKERDLDPHFTRAELGGDEWREGTGHDDPTLDDFFPG